MDRIRSASHWKEAGKCTYAVIRMMIRMGSFAIVMQNMAAGGPNEMRAQPKNSLYVMTTSAVAAGQRMRSANSLVTAAR